MDVNFKPTFVKKFKNLDADLQEEILEKIELFRDTNNHQQLKVHKRSGPLKDRYSFSVNYKTRVVFEYISKKEVVLLAIGDHNVYKN